MSENKNEWRKIIKYEVGLLPRTGWIAVWDALVSAITRQPLKTVPTDIAMSVWVKGNNDVRLELFGAQVETGPNTQENKNE